MGIKNKFYQYKSIFLSNRVLRNFLISRKLKAGELIKAGDFNNYISEANEVILPSKQNLNIGIVAGDDEYEKYGYYKARSYYHKFERFCLNNELKYSKYDIYKSDWLVKAVNFDLIIWHTGSDPISQKIAKSKLYILDKVMHKNCIPSFDEVWSYESKIHMHYLYQNYKLPEIPTFVSHNKSDALEFCEKTSYPIISKLDTGSGSQGVVKINSYKKATQMVKKAFSSGGIQTYFPTERQKNYVLFQKFISGADYDLRIIVIGNKLLGYYRYPKKGDYKASGAGIYQKKEIPIEALELAFQVKEKFKSRFLATDLLYSKKDMCYYIIESSIFIGVDTCEQLVVEGKPGYYERVCSNKYVFKEGKYWVQELILEECLNTSSAK